MSYRKNEWEDIPAFVRPLRESFPSGFPKKCAVIYVSMPLLIDALHLVRRVKCDEFHFTHDLFTEVTRQRYSHEKDHVQVKVTEYVLMQKDLEMQIRTESLAYWPCPERLSALRHVLGRLEGGRSFAGQGQLDHIVRGESLEPAINIPYTGLEF